MTDTEAIFFLNQMYYLEQRLRREEIPADVHRPVERMREFLSDLGFRARVPLGEPFDECRTDCQATVAGATTDGLVIAEVIKPAVWRCESGQETLIQRAVVIVRAAEKGDTR